MTSFSAARFIRALMVLLTISCSSMVYAAEPSAPFTVEIADVGKNKVLAAYLTSKGITAVIPASNMWVVDEQANNAVWIGKKVPLQTLQVVLPEALRLNPFLKFFHVVGDRGEKPPEKTHNTIHIGGHNEAALLKKLTPIPHEELLKVLAQAKSIEDLHQFLHNKNSVLK